MRRPNNMQISNQWVKEIKEGIKKYLETNENGNTTSKIRGTQQKQF